MIQGGKTVYGASVGILMLESRFPRIPGDMGNAGTWRFPVLYKVVKGANPDLVVRRQAKGLRDAFVDAAKELAETGADGITTNCGFLSIFQDDIAKAVNIPVVASTLMQVSMVNKLLTPGHRAGILTISGSTLSREHLDAAGVPEGTPVESTGENDEFTRAILDDLESMDVEIARNENVEAARSLIRKNPDVGAIVLECTNMTPYAADIRKAVDLPVFTAESMVSWFHSSLSPRRYD